MKDCRLYYFFGMHQKLIDVPSYEFDSVIDELSTEFEIITDDDVWNSYEHPGYICKETYYFLIDYLGNRVKIGDTFERLNANEAKTYI